MMKFSHLVNLILVFLHSLWLHNCTMQCNVCIKSIHGKCEVRHWLGLLIVLYAWNPQTWNTNTFFLVLTTLGKMANFALPVHLTASAALLDSLTFPWRNFPILPHMPKAINSHDVFFTCICKVCSNLHPIFFFSDVQITWRLLFLHSTILFPPSTRKEQLFSSYAVVKTEDFRWFSKGTYTVRDKCFSNTLFWQNNTPWTEVCPWCLWHDCVHFRQRFNNWAQALITMMGSTHSSGSDTQTLSQHPDDIVEAR